VLHALELAREDLERWCADLSDAQLNAGTSGLNAVAFHLRHIARSLDRLLTYAEGRQLNNEQLVALKAELNPGATRDELFRELRLALEESAKRVRAFDPATFGEQRFVGKKRLPTTLAGLLVHVADHSQRHVGQAITTSKLVRSLL